MENRYRRGHFEPLVDERVDFDLPVQGALPAGLDGLYARTGSNPLPGRPLADLHQLTTDGMVHAVRLQGGRCVWYRNRWVDSPDVARVLGRPPPAAADALVPEGAGNANLLTHAGRLYAFSEMALPYELSGSLETLGLCDFGGPMPAGSIAHPKLHPHSGELHTLAYHPDAPYLRHHVVDPRGRVIAQRILPVERPALVHDFALGHDHILVFDLPVLFSEEAMFDGEPLPYRWHAGAPARVGRIPIDGSMDAARWWDMPSCWVAHVAALREVDGCTEVDLIRRPSLFETDLRGDQEGEPQLVRCRLEAGRSEALVDVLDERMQDFPARDPRTPAGAEGPLWTLGLAEDAGTCQPAGDRIIEHRLAQDRHEAHPLPAGWLASELTFVPRHARAPLGDGWLLGFLHERSTKAARFAVFDARAPGSEPVAMVDLPRRVPFGSHGCWLPDHPAEG